MNKKYCIYAHINLLNGKTYIGQTKQSLSRRFRSGEGYKGCTLFYNAIKKYGWNNFKHIILLENLSLEEANLIEQYLIKKFDLTNKEKGYNISEGGNGFPLLSSELISKKNKENWEKGTYNNVKNKVYCVELEKSFESALEAERQTGIDNSTIQKACKNKIKYTGFSPYGDPLHWIFEEEITEEKIKELYYKEEVIKGIKIPIYCPELNLIFNSTSEIYNLYKIDPSSIRKVIRGIQKTAGKHPITNEKLHWEEKRELIKTKNKISIEKWKNLKSK